MDDGGSDSLAMITYLVTHRHSATVTRFLGARGRSLQTSVRVVAYPRSVRPDTPAQDWQPLRAYLPSPSGFIQRERDRLRGCLRRSGPRAGVFIFSDIERLESDERERASELWSALEESGHALQLLNHPQRALRRYALLRTLAERGLNDFDVYRLSEARRPARYPVFLRYENDHRGSRSDLLRSPEDLEAKLRKRERKGRRRDGVLITEFCAEQDARGLYRKYAAWCVGGRIIPGHLFFGPNWMLKKPAALDRESLDAELEFLETDPHSEALARIFELAKIDYGRVDYGVFRGRIQVYEINTNPGIPSGFGRRAGSPRDEADRRFNARFVRALRGLDSGASPP